LILYGRAHPLESLRAWELGAFRTGPNSSRQQLLTLRH